MSNECMDNFLPPTILSQESFPKETVMAMKE